MVTVASRKRALYHRKIRQKEAKLAAPHAIHEEFPNDAEIIHQLKVSDAHFAKLLDEYDSLNDEVVAIPDIDGIERAILQATAA